MRDLVASASWLHVVLPALVDAVDDDGPDGDASPEHDEYRDQRP
jgi:hypothetical protein